MERSNVTNDADDDSATAMILIAVCTLHIVVHLLDSQRFLQGYSDIIEIRAVECLEIEGFRRFLIANGCARHDLFNAACVELCEVCR